MYCFHVILKVNKAALSKLLVYLETTIRNVYYFLRCHFLPERLFIFPIINCDYFGEKMRLNQFNDDLMDLK